MFLQLPKYIVLFFKKFQKNSSLHAKYQDIREQNRQKKPNNCLILPVLLNLMKINQTQQHQIN